MIFSTSGRGHPREKIEFYRMKKPYGIIFSTPKKFVIPPSQV